MAASDPIATSAELAAIGYTVTDAMIARASARIRGYTKQDITLVADDVTTMPADDPLYLPQRPVVAVTKVEQLFADDSTTEIPPPAWQLRNNVVYGIKHRSVWPFLGLAVWVKVTYTHGFAAVPTELLDVVGSVAERMSDKPIGGGIEAGIARRQIDDFSEEFSESGLETASGLLPGEKAALRRILGLRSSGTVRL